MTIKHMDLGYEPEKTYWKIDINILFIKCSLFLRPKVKGTQESELSYFGISHDTRYQVPVSCRTDLKHWYRSSCENSVDRESGSSQTAPRPHFNTVSYFANSGMGVYVRKFGRVKLVRTLAQEKHIVLVCEQWRLTSVCTSAKCSQSTNNIGILVNKYSAKWGLHLELARAVFKLFFLGHVSWYLYHIIISTNTCYAYLSSWLCDTFSPLFKLSLKVMSNNKIDKFANFNRFKFELECWIKRYIW